MTELTLEQPVANAGESTSYVHRLRVRYGECDGQGVVFNANYLAYIDDVLGEWFRARFGSWEESGFDCMVKKASIEWSSPARPGEILEFVPEVTRWGNTSFDVGVTATAAGRPVIQATLVYVSVKPGTAETCPVPENVRKALASS